MTVAFDTTAPTTTTPAKRTYSLKELRMDCIAQAFKLNADQQYDYLTLPKSQQREFHGGLYIPFHSQLKTITPSFVTKPIMVTHIEDVPMLVVRLIDSMAFFVVRQMIAPKAIGGPLGCYEYTDDHPLAIFPEMYSAGVDNKTNLPELFAGKEVQIVCTSLRSPSPIKHIYTLMIG